MEDTLHLRRVVLCPDRYPTRAYYPFNLDLLHKTRIIGFSSPVTFFVGENGTGKSTLLKAICRKCGIHMWRGEERVRFEANPYEEELYKAIDVEWTHGPVPGSLFASEIFQNFAQLLDEWAAATPQIFEYFGGKSLITQSHGQSLMSYFEARYRIRGIYFLDEPETALSPKSQLALLKVLRDMARVGHAQFVVATHSPILMACPGAVIYSFDHAPVREIAYEETEHYRVYRGFMKDRDQYLDAL